MMQAPCDPVDPGLRKFQKELNAGTVSLTLLGLLAGAEEPLYGYEITRRLTVAAGGSPLLAQGTVYPVLRSLEGQGLLASRLEPSAAGPPRRYYAITAAGRDALALWSRAWARTRDVVDAVLEHERSETDHARQA